MADGDAAKRFPTLRANLEAGIAMVWNQRLAGVPLAGRRFELVPEVSLVSSKAPRDENCWLITVRPSDTGPIVYEGTSLGSAPGGVPTSATDPALAGGVMSIPPSHVTKPGVLGHELLRLFGLVDRYMATTQGLPSGKVQHANVPLRETKGRPDPIGAADARILGEDLTNLFERLGVYDVEANRGLDTLRQLERQGLSYGEVVVELHRQEEIIGLGLGLARPGSDGRPGTASEDGEAR